MCQVKSNIKTMIIYFSDCRGVMQADSGPADCWGNRRDEAKIQFSLAPFSFYITFEISKFQFIWNQLPDHGAPLELKTWFYAPFILASEKLYRAHKYRMVRESRCISRNSTIPLYLLYFIKSSTPVFSMKSEAF